jgi:diguanylate cyclase (GGDEF)-like protein/hemerythrin-like metal-binding protein/PAS domain S-box-containing protein
MDDQTCLTDVFVWSSRFETGLRDVDVQHAKLVQMINALAQISVEGCDPNKLLTLLDELQDYAGYHFKTEEDLMAQYTLNTDFVAAHVRSHESLREQVRIVRNLAEGAESNAGVAVGRLLPFLTKWLLFHVLGTDMRMAHEIIALQRGEAPAQAEHQALAQQSESMIVLLDALNEITDNLTRRTTQLQESNQRLRISEARYAMAQRVARIGSWDLNLTTHAMSWSTEVEPLFGFRLSDFKNAFEGFLACIHPSDRAGLFESLEAIHHGGNDFSHALRIVWADGSIRWLSMTGECVRGRAGEPDRLVGVLRDVTDENTEREKLRDTNAQLKLSLTAVERHAADLTRLNELNEGLQSCLTSSEAFEVVEHILARLNLGSGGALAAQTLGEHDLITTVRWGNNIGMSARFEPSECWGMRRNRRHTLHHLADGNVCKHFESLPTTAYICHPLLVLGETLGLLTVSAPPDVSEREWERIIHISAMVAESLKLALSNVRLREALHDQAIRDPLTGLLNRRYLDETLPREIVRAKREMRPLSIVMLDLDHFKQVNDTWGHEAGDAVLLHLSQILKQNLRSSDLACRFGGEEFVVVMLGANLAEARERTELIAKRMRETPIQLAQLTLPAVTFSAGLVQAERHGDTADTLLRAVDHALYAAKDSGRDRVNEPSAL